MTDTSQEAPATRSFNVKHLSMSVEALSDLVSAVRSEDKDSIRSAVRAAEAIIYLYEMDYNQKKPEKIYTVCECCEAVYSTTSSRYRRVCRFCQEVNGWPA